MKKYFLYELKKNAFAIGVIAFVVTAIYMAFVLTTFQSSYDINANVDVIAFIGGALAVCIPVWAFAYKMKKRSVDMYYALPLKRVEILAVKYLIGLLAIVLPFTVAYWLGALATFVKVSEANPDGMGAVYYIPYYFAALGALFCIYSVSAFAYTRANRIIDGILFIVFWMIALALVVLFINRIVGAALGYDGFFGFVYSENPDGYFIFPTCFSPIAPLDYATRFFRAQLESNALISSDWFVFRNQRINMGVGFALTALCAVGANVWLFLGEKRQRAENVGQVSESAFGYKVMIPLFTVCLIGIADLIPLIALVIVGAFALTAVYRHSVKIGVKQAVIYAASVFVGITVDLIIRSCV